MWLYPPHQRLLLLNSWLNTVPSEISSLVNLTRIRIPVHGGEASKEGIRILSSLPMLLSLTVYLWYDGNVLHPRHAIGRQGFQRLVKFYFFCWHEAALMFEPGAMPPEAQTETEGSKLVQVWSRWASSWDAESCSTQTYGCYPCLRCCCC